MDENILSNIKKVGLIIPMWNSVYLLALQLYTEHKGVMLQEAIAVQRPDIIVDGVIGPQTVSLMSMCEPVTLINSIAEVVDKYRKKDNPLLLENKIMGYLAVTEGTYLHWNKYETTPTLPYGIYIKKFPRVEPTKYMYKLAKKYGYYPITKHNIRALWDSVTITERRKLKHLAYDFFIDNFLDKEITKVLQEHPKSALSVFSNSVNGGKSRGIKSLQKAMCQKLTGIFKHVNKTQLMRVVKIKSDDELNQEIGDYMKDFYAYLVRKNKKRYGIYYKGWINRLIGLEWIPSLHRKDRCK